MSISQIGVAHRSTPCFSELFLTLKIDAICVRKTNPMSDDPRKAKTLGEACENVDGSFNGIKMISWLSEVLNPGKGIPEEEVLKIWEEVRVKKNQKK
jgi:hypothetical protein